MTFPLTRPRRLARILFVAVCLASCREPTEPIRIARTRVQPEWVAGEAATSLDHATGLFRLNYPEPRYMALSLSDRIAIAAAHALGGPDPFNTAAGPLERDRGGPIDFAHLNACERPVYEFSPLDDLPPAVPGVLRRAWGPKWAIALCGADHTVQLSIGVPDNPTDLLLDNGQLLHNRTQGGGYDFNAAGVPPRFPYGLPLSPEDAVASVFRLTGQRTVTTPAAYNQLDDAGAEELPLCASWRLSVEAPVSVRSERTGAVTPARDFFVRHVPTCYSDTVALYIASINQPTSHALIWTVDTVANSTSLGFDTLVVPLTGPVAFERVTVSR